MKKILFSILLAVFAIGQLSARDTEVSVSYGAMPAMKSLGVYHNHWDGLDNWGAINATIDHKFAPGLWIGLSYTYSSADSDHAWDGRYGKVTWHGLMANVRYEWLHRGPVTMYSHVGIGALVEYYSPSWEDSYNRTNMAFQISPVGLQIDIIPQLGVFAEAGYGVQGIIKAGLRFGF
ncbi:MAG: hypothetical protein NC111_03660 [Bacteroides sp.]|nr:hypothetical protein [Bacteroides sp.]MCM1412948.1 hypothetical protein [Bacteroides sp.]MCM1471609.1 hypothetical protein [Bacteroides sp.]